MSVAIEPRTPSVALQKAAIEQAYDPFAMTVGNLEYVSDVSHPLMSTDDASMCRKL